MRMFAHVWNSRQVMRVVDLAKARSCLEDLIAEVIQDADITIITQQNTPGVVLMPMATFTSLMETVHLLSTPANASHLARSLEQFRQGQTVQRDLIDVE